MISNLTNDSVFLTTSSSYLSCSKIHLLTIFKIPSTFFSNLYGTPQLIIFVQDLINLSHSPLVGRYDS